MYVLGIDGGGTKTKGVIANARGTIMAETSVGPTNPNSVERKVIENELIALMTSLETQNYEVFHQISGVFAGMSGVRDISAKKDMEQLIASLFKKSVDVSVDNDAVIALYSGTLGTSGIVQIAGTGSITYGINEHGKHDRVGGWGHIIGELGSGYGIGNDALRRSFLAYDGMASRTDLIERICDFFEKASLPDILPDVYQVENVKEQVASLSKLVIDAADNRDDVAKEIIHKHGLYIGESIVSMINKLFISQNSKINNLPIVLTGGLFNRLDLFEDSIRDKLYQAQVGANLIIPAIEPVGGAIVAALQANDVKIHNEFPTNFQS